MQYLLMLYSREGEWVKLPSAVQEEGVAADLAFGEALKNAGVLRGNNRLRPSSDATTIRMADGKAQVLDGPYADTKEQVGGYYLIEVPDFDAAIMWAGRCPGASHGLIEVRPVWQ
jgi:hypothetical protein